MARPHNVPMRRFEPMSRLPDFKVQRGSPDPRGWKVLDGEGQAIGIARDLVVDTDRMTAAYVDVELEPRIFGSHDDPHVLVPMRRAERAGSERKLVVADLTRSRVAALRAARAEHDARFWEQWWETDRAARPASMEQVPDMAVPPAGYDAPAPVRPRDEVLTDEDAVPFIDEERRIEARPFRPDERIAAWRPEDAPERRRQHE